MTMSFIWIKIFVILAMTSLIKEIGERQLFVLLRELVGSLQETCAVKPVFSIVIRSTLDSSNNWKVAIRKTWFWEFLEIFQTAILQISPEKCMKWIFRGMHILDINPVNLIKIIEWLQYRLSCGTEKILFGVFFC